MYSSPFSMESRAGIFSLFRNRNRLVGTFRWLEDPSIAWASTFFTAEDPALLKTVFFRQVRELKTRRKNPGSALRDIISWLVFSVGLILAFEHTIRILVLGPLCVCNAPGHRHHWNKGL